MQELQDSGRERGCLSLLPSLLLQGEIGMEGPHSLLAMYVSAEMQTLDHIWYRGRARQKNQHVVNFQTTEDKLLPFIPQGMKTHKELSLFVDKLRT